MKTSWDKGFKLKEKKIKPKTVAKVVIEKEIYPDFSVISSGIKALETETVLPDDYPMYADYSYILDGSICHCWVTGYNVREIKRRNNVTEIRRLDVIARPEFINFTWK